MVEHSPTPSDPLKYLEGDNEPSDLNPYLEGESIYGDGLERRERYKAGARMCASLLFHLESIGAISLYLEEAHSLPEEVKMAVTGPLAFVAGAAVAKDRLNNGEDYSQQLDTPPSQANQYNKL